jgi:hypothetical protein
MGMGGSQNNGGMGYPTMAFVGGSQNGGGMGYPEMAYVSGSQNRARVDYPELGPGIPQEIVPAIMAHRQEGRRGDGYWAAYNTFSDI